MKFHALCHVPFEGLAYLEPWILMQDHSLTFTHFWKSDALPSFHDFDALIVMGGPMNIYEDKKYPWLTLERKFIQNAIRAKKKVLGICLGAQLIADVLGAQVYKNPQKEIGWLPIEWTAESKNLEEFPSFSGQTIVFQWHGDTYPLPKGAVHLARSPVCENQAFLYEGRVLGLQFHLESTPESVRRLIEHCREELVSAPMIQSEKEILSHVEYFSGNYKVLEKILKRLI